MTPESKQLTDSTWFGSHIAAEDANLTAHGAGKEHGSSTLHDEKPFTLNAGEEFSVRKMTSEHAFLVVAGQTIVIARTDIQNILVRA